MKFGQLLQIVGNLPLFHSGLLLAGEVDPADVQRQLVRWTAAGRLIQIRRGLYALAPPYQRTRPDHFLVANQLQAPSYVSCQSALSFHGLIPEGVPVVASVTTGRTAQMTTPLGTYHYCHVKHSLFRGFERLKQGSGQFVFMATPEKALLDLVHLVPRADSEAYLEGLRLQNLAGLDVARLHTEADGTPKLRRAARIVERMAEVEKSEWVTL